MGALEGDEEAEEHEKPRHKVTLTKNQLVSVYLCSQVLYESVMGESCLTFMGTHMVRCVGPWVCPAQCAIKEETKSRTAVP